MIGSHLPSEGQFKQRLAWRKFRGEVWRWMFRLSTAAAILALIALFYNIIDSSFGYVASQYAVEPDALVEGGDVRALDNFGLANIIAEQLPRRLPVFIRDELTTITGTEFTTLPVSHLLAEKTYPPETADLTIRELSAGQMVQILADNLSHDALLSLVNDEIISEQILATWSLTTSLFNKAEIDQAVAEKYPHAAVYFRSWLNSDFLSSMLSTRVVDAGVRSAVLGTLWVMVLTIIFAFPLGVGAAIYLEEYASGSLLHRIIETNIRNLAGVPSIIYGLLGLAIFVRLLGGITGGSTVLSAALTMALLILPVIIINSQEALRAVAPSIREASYGLGATQWQTIWNQVLPAALPGIMTGTILSMSRAIGETAPLIVVGASTFLLADPNGPLSRFTVLPIQIFGWTANSQPQIRNLAAAAIIVLMIMLLTLNATAIILRQRFRKKLQG